MKMEHQITAPQGGIVRLIAAKMGDTLITSAGGVWIKCDANDRRDALASRGARL